MMQSFQECDNFSGSVLVAAQEEIILAKGYGPASIELNVPNDRETAYRMSIQKEI